MPNEMRASVTFIPTQLLPLYEGFAPVEAGVDVGARNVPIYIF